MRAESYPESYPTWERWIGNLIWGTNPDGWRSRAVRRDIESFVVERAAARRYLLALIRFLTSLAWSTRPAARVIPPLQGRAGVGPRLAETLGELAPPEPLDLLTPQMTNGPDLPGALAGPRTQVPH